MVDFRKFLFLFRDFLVRIWLAKALLLTKLPVAVLLNRFNAPLFVFILGMKNLAPQLVNLNDGVTEKPLLLFWVVNVLNRYIILAQ